MGQFSTAGTAGRSVITHRSAITWAAVSGPCMARS